MTRPPGASVSVLTKVRVSDLAARRLAADDTFLVRAFAEGEREQCLARRRPDHGLAARYAARASLARACQEHGVEAPASAEDARIVHDALGAPRFVFGDSSELRSGGRRFQVFVSLAHDGNLACALVLVRESLDGA